MWAMGRGEGLQVILSLSLSLWEHGRKILFAYEKSETRLFEVSFCSLIKGITPEILMLGFVLISSVLLNLLCIWILSAYGTAHQNNANRSVQA